MCRYQAHLLTLTRSCAGRQWRSLPHKKVSTWPHVCVCLCGTEDLMAYHEPANQLLLWVQVTALALRDRVAEQLQGLLDADHPELRAAAVFTLGALVRVCTEHYYPQHFWTMRHAASACTRQMTGMAAGSARSGFAKCSPYLFSWQDQRRCCSAACHALWAYSDRTSAVLKQVLIRALYVLLSGPAVSINQEQACYFSTYQDAACVCVQGYVRNTT